MQTKGMYTRNDKICWSYNCRSGRSTSSCLCFANTRHFRYPEQRTVCCCNEMKWRPPLILSIKRGYMHETVFFRMFISLEWKLTIEKKNSYNLNLLHINLCGILSKESHPLSLPQQMRTSINRWRAWCSDLCLCIVRLQRIHGWNPCFPFTLFSFEEQGK